MPLSGSDRNPSSIDLPLFSSRIVFVRRHTSASPFHVRHEAIIYRAERSPGSVFWNHYIATKVFCARFYTDFPFNLQAAVNS